MALSILEDVFWEMPVTICWGKSLGTSLDTFFEDVFGVCFRVIT